MRFDRVLNFVFLSFSVLSLSDGGGAAWAASSEASVGPLDRHTQLCAELKVLDDECPGMTTEELEEVLKWSRTPVVVQESPAARVEIERDRSGGRASTNADLSIDLEVEGVKAKLNAYQVWIPVPGRSKTQFRFGGNDAREVCGKVYAEYSKTQPHQIVRSMGLDIVYAAGITCLHEYDSRLASHSNDAFVGVFVVEKDGGTVGPAVLEPRGRGGASN